MGRRRRSDYGDAEGDRATTASGVLQFSSSGRRDGGQFARRCPSPPRRPSGNRGVTAMGEVPVFLPCGAERCRGSGARESAARGVLAAKKTATTVVPTRRRRRGWSRRRFCRKPPPSSFPFYFSLFSKIQKLFLDLIEVLKHFRKFCKYLWGLLITCRSSTKIGIAK